MGNKVYLEMFHFRGLGTSDGTLLFTELQERKPDFTIFLMKAFTGEYPSEAPFTISELEEIYPCASKKSKEDAAF